MKELLSEDLFDGAVKNETEWVVLLWNLGV